MTREEFVKLTNENGLFLTEKQEEQLEEYFRMLVEKNKVMNLTGITEHNEVFEKHFYDSLLFTFAYNLTNQKLIDVGTGAGFPGLVLAICFPNVFVTLLEPLNKRCNFLQEVVDELGLKNVQIINERSEDYSKLHDEEYDIVIFRAVSRLNILLEIGSKMLKVGGYLIALKGRAYQEEVNECDNALKKLNLTVEKIQTTSLPSENDVRGNIFIKKIDHTPSNYPRNYGQIKKKPL
jgi:16S rRNA (guanine527-N7)-methyltransferase